MTDPRPPALAAPPSTTAVPPTYVVPTLAERMLNDLADKAAVALATALAGYGLLQSDQATQVASVIGGALVALANVAIAYGVQVYRDERLRAVVSAPPAIPVTR